MAYFLAQKLGDVDAYLEAHSNPRKILALDTEYTTLNLPLASLTGLSISLQSGTALYIPVGHRLGKNVELRGAIDRIHRHIEEHELIVTYFIAKGDRTMLLKEANWAPVRFRDVAEGRYLWNCERKRNNDLKSLSKELLNFDMARFDSLFTPIERKAKHLDISAKTPEKSRDYACADADATFRLDEHFDFIWKEYGARVVPIDMAVSDEIATMEYEGGLELNPEYIQEQQKLLSRRLRALEAVVHRAAGQQFDVNSTKQLAPILFEQMGIAHPFDPKKQRGKSGQWVTNADALEAIADKHPIGELIISYRKVYRALNTYIKRLLYLVDEGLAPRFTLNQYRATTFRLSAPGGDPRRDGKTGLNAQAIGKGESRNLTAVDLSAQGSTRDYVDSIEDDEIMVDLSEEFGPGYDEVHDVLAQTDDTHRDLLRSLPYVVETNRESAEGVPFLGLACFRDHCAQCPALCEQRQIDVTRRRVKDCRVIPSMRRAFRAPEGYSMVSLDYDGQEIVIAANLSGEPVWIDTLLSDDPDVHASTARAAFGFTLDEWERLAEHIRKYHRETGKRLNFGTLFGATPHTLARKMGIPLAKAEEIWEAYRQGLPVLMRWISDVIATARTVGYTQTFLLNRRRPLSQFYNLHGPDARKMAAYADRCAVNTWIQGTGADATRIAMARIRARLRREQIERAQCRLGLQIHDELMYVVRDADLDRIVPILKAEMEFKVKSWKVQLTVGAKVGRVWGVQEKWS